MLDKARTDDQLAAALYGTKAPPAHVAPTESIARTFEQIAAAVHDKPELPPEELPAEVKALREADPVRRIYNDAKTFKDAGIGQALEELGIEGEQLQVEQRAWAGVMGDMGVSATEATDLVQLALMDTPEPAVIEGWAGEAMQGLRDAFGDDADQALADARLLISRDPRVKDFLNRTRMGNHPRVVLLAAERARAAFAAGTLKRN